MDKQRIKCEAIIINKIFAARKLAGVHVLDGGNGMPTFLQTPNTIVYALNVPMAIDGNKLVAIQDDLGAYINQFYDANGIIVRDSAGQQISPAVRIDRKWRKVEVQRPDPVALHFKDVRWDGGEFNALMGVRFTGKGIVPITWNVTANEAVHTLVAGTTGSGKTNEVMTILYSLAMTTPSAKLRYLILDPKRSDDMWMLRNLPHTEVVAREYNEMIAVLKNLYREMEERERGNVPKDVRIMLVLEEAASLTDHGDKAIKKLANYLLEEIGRRGRESNINLVICTQRPTADVLGSQLKDMLHIRAVGALTSQDAAFNAVGIKQSGAEALPGRGAMIYRLQTTMFRLQAPLIDQPALLIRTINNNETRPIEIRNWKADPESKSRRIADNSQTPQMPSETSEDVDEEEAIQRMLEDAAKIRPVWQQNGSMADMLRAVSGNPNIHTGSAWWRGRVLTAVAWLEETAQPDQVEQAAPNGDNKIIKMKRKAG